MNNDKKQKNKKLSLLQTDNMKCGGAVTMDWN